MDWQVEWNCQEIAGFEGKVERRWNKAAIFKFTQGIGRILAEEERNN